MQYKDIPKPWKQRISGSINYYVTYDENQTFSDLLETWIENRIIKEDGRIYFVTSDPFNKEKFQLSEELYKELLEIIKSRFNKNKG